jgi:Ala-tRNA(Pro) deacylase
MEMGAIRDEDLGANKFLPGYTREIPRRLIRCLNDSGVRYYIQHEPDSNKLVQESVDLVGFVHTAVIRAGKQRLLAVVPNGCDIDLKKFGTLVGERARLETEDEFKWLFPDCALGAVPPFGNLYGLATWLDTSLTKTAEISFLAGTFIDAIKLSYSAYAEVVGPRIGKFGANSGRRRAHPSNLRVKANNHR